MHPVTPDPIRFLTEKKFEEFPCGELISSPIPWASISSPSMPARHSSETVDAVVSGWVAVASLKALGSDVGLSVKQICSIIALARRRGDPRTVRRYVKGGKDGRSHDSRGIYRTREEMRGLREFVLDRWQAGDITRQISRKIFISHSYADSIVMRARAAGDPRAAYR